MEGYRYRPEVLRTLERYGIVPGPSTRPELVYEHLKSLYTFEIRKMKLARRELERAHGRQPLDDYRRGLEALKERYFLLKMPGYAWVESE